MSKLKHVVALLSLGGLSAFARPTEAAGGVLPASAGFAQVSEREECFYSDWSNPGRIQYDACSGLPDEWWEIPMPADRPAGQIA